MPIDVKWYDESQTIIVLNFPTRWSWDELFCVVDKINGWLGHYDHFVGCMLKFEPDTILPANPITHARQFLDAWHPNLRHIVVINPTQLMLIAYQTLQSRYLNLGLHISLAQTEHEAINTLYSIVINPQDSA